MSIKSICNSIRKAVYGKEVRESIAKGIESINEIAEETDKNQANLEEKFNQLIINAGNSNAEIVMARTDSNGKTYETLGDRINNESKNLDLYKKGIRNLDYLSVTNTLISEALISDTIYKHLQYQGINQTLVVTCKLEDKYSNEIQMKPLINITNCIEKALSYNVKTVMLKPHLGFNFQDSPRNDLQPTNVDLFFDNWLNVLLDLADICETYNIPVLCIGCEQQNQTYSTYKSYWKNICTEIKKEHPSLLLTYACNSVEWLRRDDTAIFECVDIIGINAYIRWYNGEWNENVTWKDLIQGQYNCYDDTKYGCEMMNRISYLADKYNKPIYITESGVMPYKDGLYNLKSSYSSDVTMRDYNVTATYLESVFNVLCKHPDVIGFSLWHVKPTFDYFDINSETLGESSAEELIKKYIEEGLV